MVRTHWSRQRCPNRRSRQGRKVRREKTSEKNTRVFPSPSLLLRVLLCVAFALASLKPSSPFSSFVCISVAWNPHHSYGFTSPAWCSCGQRTGNSLTVCLSVSLSLRLAWNCFLLKFTQGSSDRPHMCGVWDGGSCRYLEWRSRRWSIESISSISELLILCILVYVLHWARCLPLWVSF